MKIKKISFKNIMSYGNKITTIDFEKNQGFYILCGKIGSGKTTFLNSIGFALYGKIPDKKQKDIANRRNKKTYVKIEFESNNKNVIIERTINPSKLNINVDGIVIDQAGIKDLQSYLEEEIIGIPYHVFNNIVSLNINSFTSFLSMNNEDKRKIIDKIFGIFIFNMIREKMKTEIKEFKSNLDKYNGEISALESKSISYKENILSLQEELKKFKNEKYDELNNKIEELTHKYTKYGKIINKISSKKNIILNEMQSIIDNIQNYNNNYKLCNNKLSLYNNDKCIECGSNLKTDFHKEKKIQLENDIKEYSYKIKEYKILLEKFNEDISNIDKKIQDKKNLESELKYTLSNLKKQINNIESLSKEKNSIDLFKNLIVENNLILDDKNKDKIKISKKIKLYSELDDIMSENGIKKFIFETITPTFNYYLNSISKEMDIEYDIIFDNNFDGKILHFNEEINPLSLSSGERKQIDIITVLSFIKLVKNKFPELNLLILDELFSNIDYENIEYMIKIIKKMTKELSINTIIVNHSELPHHHFNYILKAEKRNGFSQLEYENIIVT